MTPGAFDPADHRLHKPCHRQSAQMASQIAEQLLRSLVTAAIPHVSTMNGTTTMTYTRLEQEFLEDHRHLTRGFQSLIDAVERNDVERCRRDASELDCIAGPHIEFEEHVLYPRVRNARGDELGTRLLREHQVARSALLFLESRGTEPLNPADRARVLEQLRVGLEHAVTCGTLLNHLTVLDDTEQDEMLKRLHEFKSNNMRWTELSGQVPATVAGSTTPTSVPH